MQLTNKMEGINTLMNQKIRSILIQQSNKVESFRANTYYDYSSLLLKRNIIKSKCSSRNSSLQKEVLSVLMIVMQEK